MRKKPSRAKVMLQGELKKGDRTILTVGNSRYRIQKELSEKIRLKNILLGAETLILTILYRLAMRKFEEIPWKGADPALIGEGLMITFLFLGSLAAAFLLTSVVLLPEDMENHLEELEEAY